MLKEKKRSDMPTHRKGALILGALIVVIYHCSKSFTEHRDLSSVVNARTEAKARVNRTILGFTEEDSMFSNSNHIKVVYSTGSSAGGKEEVNLSMGYTQEPYSHRWQRRFASSQSRKKKSGYLFFRHTRKAGGTSLRVFFKDVLAFHNVTRTAKDFRAAKRRPPPEDFFQIHYIESEFRPIDWQCPSVDPRWRDSLRVIVLRHPIERHMSEFFFSGPKRGHRKMFPIDVQQLFVNSTYTDELASFLNESVPRWVKGSVDIIGNKTKTEGTFFDIFGRHYTDNFQLRSLAGCTSGECLKERRLTQAQLEKINQFHPSSYSYSKPIPRCTNYFRKEDDPSVLLEFCAKPYKIIDECSILGCDGPCFYPSAAWGPLGSGDIARAVNVLKGFDAVLLMEKLDDADQSDFLLDVLGVPCNAEFALSKRGSSYNSRVEIRGKREKSSYYRRLLSKLGLEHVLQMLREDNKLEMEFFQHAKRLNEIMIEQWKRESANT